MAGLLGNIEILTRLSFNGEPARVTTGVDEGIGGIFRELSRLLLGSNALTSPNGIAIPERVGVDGIFFLTSIIT